MSTPQRFFFWPKMLDSWPSYTRARLLGDVGAGVTVGVVALPLAMAFAIASGLKPEAGLFTAIIAGFLISALGGSRVQIGGPAGAFIVIVYGIVQRYGYANLVIATAMSGVMLFAFGFFKLGTLVRFIPIAVVIGFTNGIAVLIAVSQIKEFLGLQVSAMPADFFGIVHTLGLALPSWNPSATGLALGCLALMVAWQSLVPRWAVRQGAQLRWAAHLSVLPGSVVALVAATALVSFTQLPVQTIGSRFGDIPSSLPAFAWPEFSWATVRFLFIPATTLALLGAIESLLCARVADGMTGERHNPNQELMAQGIANIVTPFFGGMPATGTIARTVVNVKSGATSPVAGMVHALTLLAIVAVAAPLAKDIPLPAMAAILMFVAWNMGDWRAFAQLRQYRLPYRVTLLAVFALTVVFDLTVAVEVGLVAACITFIYRISSLSRSEPVVPADHACLQGLEGQVAAYRLYGALFFGAVQLLEQMEDALPRHALVLDFKNVIYMDSSGADTLLELAHTCHKHQLQLVVCGLMYQPRDIAERTGLLKTVPNTQVFDTLAQGVAYASTVPHHTQT